MMRGDKPYFPEWLHEWDYPHIGSYILRDALYEPKPPTSACLVVPDQPLPPVYEDWHVTAFRRQINQATLWPWTIDERIGDKSATTYVAVAPESVPLFDVVRGFYAKHEQPEPHFLLADQLDTAKTLDAVAGRHVSIISHHLEYATDDDLQMVAKSLYEREAEQVSALRTHVYHYADRRDIDFNELSSRHREWMKKVGELCLWE